jgi:hypothetical protein
MPIRVDYRAPATCPSRAEFLGSVRRYTAKWTLVDDGTSRRFAVTFDRGEAAVRGTLEITLGDQTTRKVVSGPSCETVARALAVIVALVIDPGASIAGPSVSPPPADVPSKAPEPEPTSPAPSSAPPHAEETPSPSDRARSEQPRGRAPAHEASPVPRTRGWMIELRPELSSAVTRRSMAVVAAFVDVQVQLFGKTEAHHPSSGSPFGPSSVGLGVRQSLPRAIGVPGGSTEFLWSAATLRVCPFRLRLAGDRLEAAPCIEGNVGTLQAESQGLPLAERIRKYWLDGGASVLGVWHLPRPWVATAALTLVAPLTRHRFEVVDLASLSAASGPRSELVSQAPILGIRAGLGIGLEL